MKHTVSEICITAGWPAPVPTLPLQEINVYLTELLDLKYQMLRKCGHLLATSVSSSFCVQLPWAKLEDTGIDGSLMWPSKAIPQSCTEAALVALTNLSFFLCQSRSSNWDWRTSPTNVNVVWSWIQPLQPAASGCQKWLTLFYAADMRQPRAGLIADFHMAKFLVWKGHQKEKIKKFRTTWKEKETIIWSRSGFKGAASLSPSLALAEDFVPDAFTLHSFPMLSKQLCLFAIIPTPFYGCFALF